ncbi:MAG: hypothetical protein ABR555_08175 [Pyrinomonadaceae bacterium]
MKRELGLLNLICIVVAFLFLGFIVVNALTSGEMLSTDNLFITTVCLVMALMFAINPILYLKSEDKLPLPFMKSQARIKGPDQPPRMSPAATPPLLDAKGRAVPPDVRAMVSKMGQAQTKDA